VGCASIILLLPAPGYFAAKLQTVQRKKMGVVSHIFLCFSPPVLSNILFSWKQIDARIQTVSESKSVIEEIRDFI
jgi:hypothetical protein